MTVYATGENVALTWGPMPDDASTFKAADVFGRDNLHDFELRWRSIQVAANGKDPSKVLEKQNPAGCIGSDLWWRMALLMAWEIALRHLRSNFWPSRRRLA